MKVRHKKSGQVTNIVTMTVGDGTYISSALPSEFEPVIEHPDGGVFTAPFTNAILTKLDEVLTAINKQRGEPIPAQGEAVKTQPDGWFYPQTLKDTIASVRNLEEWGTALVERVNKLENSGAWVTAIHRIGTLENRVSELETYTRAVEQKHLTLNDKFYELCKSHKEALALIDTLTKRVSDIEGRPFDWRFRPTVDNPFPPTLDLPVTYKTTT